MSIDIQETLEQVNKILSEQVAKKVEEIAQHYLDVIVIKDREIEFLNRAFLQSELRCQQLQEKIDGDKPCCQSSTSNS